MGHFANVENARYFEHELLQVGFEAQTVSTGLPGEFRYEVISVGVKDPADLTELRQKIERETGTLGTIAPTPIGQDGAELVFDQPKLKYHVAQSTSVPVAGSSANRSVSGYDPMLNRSPQEEVASTIGFTTAGLQIIPTLGASIGYNTNVTLANTHEISSMFYMISPAIRVEMPSDHSVLSFIAAMNIVRYQDSSIDDQDNWYLRGEWVWDISTRQDLNLFVQYSSGVDRRGEGRRQGDAGLVPVEPDKWRRWGYGGAWDYGAVGARGRLTLRAGGTDLTYTNNREGPESGSDGTRALDRNSNYVGGTFFWRVAPKTSLLLDYLYADINYKLDDSSDSTEQSWMLGVTWDATARTSGSIRYGNGKKDFADPTKNSYDGPVWTGMVSWRPLTYSVFTLTGSRSTREPDGGGDYILRQDLTLSWIHDWATRFGTVVDVGAGTDDYRPTGRKDDLFYWGVGANYTFNQHFRFGASVTSYDRNSEVTEFNYQQMTYLLTLEATY